jgi:hypothetical protein
MKRAVAITIGALALYGCRSGQSIADAEAAQFCRADYLRSRTATDSAAVDSRRPILSRGQASTALTCGAMRRAGWLRATSK